MNSIKIKNLKFKIKQGFTLIELLVVISIIGILAGLVIASFTSSQKQARDTARKSDIKQYQTLLEQAANQTNGIYPIHTSTVGAETLCTDLSLSITCPLDSKDGTGNYGYNYVSDPTGARYSLSAYLENTTNYWGVCSNGTVITKASKPTIGDCP